MPMISCKILKIWILKNPVYESKYEQYHYIPYIAI